MTKISSKNKPSAIIALSGGVDSAVSALLLQQQGYRIKAVYMQNWQDSSNGDCPHPQDLQDAKLIASKLNIELQIVNFSEQYWQLVFQHFLDEYALGRTPNPDILCNNNIKFGLLREHVQAEGYQYLATGHYAKLSNAETPELFESKDSNKDQTYFLSGLSQTQLCNTIFPLADLKKNQVREIARRAGLANHAKKDSTGICFIGERRFQKFLSEYLLAKPGDIITESGRIIGSHPGSFYYTLGQRQGLNIGGHAEYPAGPWFVVDKDINNNQLIVSQNPKHPKLWQQELSCTTINWISQTVPILPWKCLARIRHRQKLQDCIVTQDAKGCYKVTFEQAQRAICPGQYVALYLDGRCYGSGVIN